MDNETKNFILKAIETTKFPVVDGDRFGWKAACIEFMEEKISSFFGIEFTQDVHERFVEAITGSGDELFKMDAVYSSSLFAFLFFSQVSEKNPLTIEGIKYVDAFFEFKNKVYRGGPSNMDVVLKSRTNDLLFIECKFSEYLSPDPTEISPKYFNDEQHPLIGKRLLSNKGEGIKLEPVSESDRTYQATFNGQRIFTYGIKQIVAHVIGIEHYLVGKFYKYKGKDRRNDLLKKDAFNVRFTEIVFEFADVPPQGEAYRNAVKWLFGEIKSSFEKINSVTLFGPMTYQEILNDDRNKTFKENLPEAFKEFYRL